MDAVTPGAGYAYRFPVAQRACLNWYHPHPHMMTGERLDILVDFRDFAAGDKAMLRCLKDTVLLLDGETVDVLIRFDAHRGLYVMHCHKLEHEDMGMMSNFEVV